MSEFSDYIVYVDESGDHSLTSIDSQFPVFALSFCVVRKYDYVTSIVPTMQAFKFRYWGHDFVILHEHEIRKSKNDFAFLLTDRDLRSAFYNDLNSMMEDAPIAIIASVIDKFRHSERYSAPLDPNPYDVALQFCMERLITLLTSVDQAGKHVHIVFERRGNKEDKALHDTFMRILSNDTEINERVVDFSTMKFTAHFVPKSINSTGLQLADLTARPIALKCLRPLQRNRAYEIITSKSLKIDYCT